MSGSGNPFHFLSRRLVPKAGPTRTPLDTKIDYYRSLRVPSPPPLRSSPPNPTCAACRAKNRPCVITVITGNKNRCCDYCRRTHSKCAFEGTEADQTPENAGTKRRRTGAEDSADPKGKKPRRQASEEIEIIDGPRVAEEKVSPLRPDRCEARCGQERWQKKRGWCNRYRSAHSFGNYSSPC